MFSVNYKLTAFYSLPMLSQLFSAFRDHKMAYRTLVKLRVLKLNILSISVCCSDSEYLHLSNDVATK